MSFQNVGRAMQHRNWNWRLGDVGGSPVPPPVGNVILLLNAVGVAGSSTIKDDSIYNRAVLTNSGITLESTLSPPGTVGLSLYGSAIGEFLRYTASPDFDFGTNDWTIEFWMYPPFVDATRRSVISYQFDGSASRIAWDVSWIGTELRTQIGHNGGLTTFTTAPPVAGVWTHIAIVRDGGTFRLYRDGVQAASGAAVGSMNVPVPAAQLRFFRREDSGEQMGAGAGITGVRIDSDYCIYPDGTAFAPPTPPVPDLSV